MPVTINKKEIGSDGKLCHDYEFVITDENKLADYIVRIFQAHHDHVKNVICGLTPELPENEIYHHAIRQTIKRLQKRWDTSSKTWMYKVDGLIFQMISWIVLAKIHKNDRFLMTTPHLQFAEHGFDGLAVKINDDNSIDKIVISEDKCTENDRNTIKQDVFPDFEELESHFRDFDISSILGVLLSRQNIAYSNDAEKDAMDLNKRQYRIAITRQATHESEKNRIRLFKDFDTVVDGDVSRRHASSIYLMEDERVFMDRLTKLIIEKLEQLVA